eukprot:TRINITY_DN21332_c1_g1_i1.p1 TRINITY_DN21332_c1_g1~~TRINITY_DN21332_c1_g1_i1.p1  ORF type:complete len:502 (+),score=130.31 TRINITY_DN21332_c1_g1_i1:30-1508(+)
MQYASRPAAAIGRTATWSGAPATLALGAAVSFTLQVAGMADPAAWWAVCSTTPCGAAVSLTGGGQLPECRDRPAEARKHWEAFGSPEECGSRSQVDCDHDTCYRYKMVLETGAPQAVDEEGACLRTKRARDADGHWVTFGHLCCSVCYDGAGALPSWAFAQWADRRLKCGFFSCTEGSGGSDHRPTHDWCPERSTHARALQAFSVIAALVLGVSLIAHFFDLVFPHLGGFGGYDEDGVASATRRIPMPRRLIQLHEWVHRRLPAVHIAATVCCFIAACIATAALSRSLCGARLSEYANAGFGVYALWINMGIEACLATWLIAAIATAAAARPRGAPPAAQTEGAAAAAGAGPPHTLPSDAADSRAGDARGGAALGPGDVELAVVGGPSSAAQEQELHGAVSLSAPPSRPSAARTAASTDEYYPDLDTGSPMGSPAPPAAPAQSAQSPQSSHSAPRPSSAEAAAAKAPTPQGSPAPVPPAGAAAEDSEHGMDI